MIFDFPASRTVRNKCVLFKPLSLWCFVVGALENTHHCLMRLKLFSQDTTEPSLGTWYSQEMASPSLCDGGLLGPLWPRGFLVKNGMPFLFSSPEFNSYLFLFKKSTTNHEAPRVKAPMLSLISHSPSPPYLSPKFCHFDFLRVSQISLLLFLHDDTTPCRLQLSLA